MAGTFLGTALMGGFAKEFTLPVSISARPTAHAGRFNSNKCTHFLQAKRYRPCASVRPRWREVTRPPAVTRAAVLHLSSTYFFFFERCHPNRFRHGAVRCTK